MRHVTLMGESCRACERISSRMWERHVTHMSEPYRTRTSHVVHMSESRRTYGWVAMHTWASHVPHVSESCRAHGWVVSNMVVSHVAFESVTTHMWESRVAHMSESANQMVNPLKKKKRCRSMLQINSCCDIMLHCICCESMHVAIVNQCMLRCNVTLYISEHLKTSHSWTRTA